MAVLLENNSSPSASSINIANEGKKDITSISDNSSQLSHINEDEITLKTVLPDFDGKRWYQLPHLRRLSFICFIVSLSSCNSGFDGSLFNGLYAMKDFNNAIGNVNGATLGVLSNAMLFSTILIFPINDKINDYLGRKKTLYIGNIILIMGVIVQSFSGVWIHNMPENYKGKDIFGMLVGARLIIGFGGALMSISAPSLISELSFPTHRHVTTTVYNASWYLGAIVAAWVSFGTKDMKHHWSWRIPTIFQCFFSFVQLILLPLVPESPRWLISKNRLDEAKEILDVHHGGGYESANMLVDYEMTEIELAIEQERIASATSSYKDFIKTKPNLKRLWIICWVAIFMQLSGNGLVSYYLAKVLNSIGYTSTSQQLIINAGLMIFNYGVCLIQSFFIIPNIKRRTAFNSSLFGMLFCYVIWTVLSAINQQRDFKDKSLGQGVLAMIFMYYFFYNLGLNGVSITYCTEILPFTMRAKGMNIMYLVMSVVCVYNGFVNSIAMDAIEWKYYIVYCCILAVECAIGYFTFLETSGRTLEEVAEVFGDGIQNLGRVSAIAALEDGKMKPTQSVEHREYA